MGRQSVRVRTVPKGFDRACRTSTSRFRKLSKKTFACRDPDTHKESMMVV